MDRLVKRSRFFFTVPLTIFSCVLCDFLWEVAKLNSPHNLQHDWPWRFTVLDISTSATLAGALGGLILARAQFSRAIRPDLGWYGDESGVSIKIDDAAWTVGIFNTGSGPCGIKRVEFRLGRFDENGLRDQASEWMSWSEIIDELETMKLRSHYDFHLENIVSVTYPSGNLRDAWEIAAFSESALNLLASLDLRISYEDLVGDLREKLVKCLYSAHRTVALKQSSKQLQRSRARLPSIIASLHQRQRSKRRSGNLGRR